MTSLKRRALSGMRWTMATGIVQRVIQMGAVVLLARFLEPSDFGLYALAFVMIDGLGLFKNLGLDGALIREPGDELLAANTAFWILPFVGAVLALLACGAAPLFASWVGSTDVVSVVRALSAIFVIGSLGRVPFALLTRRMEFAKRSLAQVISEAVYFLTAVWLAWTGWGVWGLVVGYLLKTVLVVVLVWWLAGWRPQVRFSLPVARRLLSVGTFLVGGSLLWFIRHQVSNLLIGKLLGVTVLGFYTIAAGPSNMLRTYLFGWMYEVTFPVFSKMQGDLEGTRRAYLKLVRYVALVALPIGVGLALVAEPLLRVVYGAKWLPAAPIMQVLAVTGTIGLIARLSAPVLHAYGRARLSFLLGTISVGVLLGLIVPLTHRWGPVGTALAVLISEVVSLGLSLAALRSVLGVPVADVGRALRSPLIGAVGLAVLVAFVRDVLPFFGLLPTQALGTLIVLAASGGVTYLGYLTIVESRFWSEIKALLR